MAQKEQAVSEIFFSKTAKIIYGSILLGMAWGRFEYIMTDSASKMGEKISKELGEKIDSYVKKFDEHIISDGFEKKALQSEVSELKAAMNKMKEQAEDFVRNEYVRPEEPRPQTERRRR